MPMHFEVNDMTGPISDGPNSAFIEEVKSHLIEDKIQNSKNLKQKDIK
jgi:hypothetical protein